MELLGEISTTSESLSILQLAANASLLVQAVMLLLLLASVVSWTVAFRKWFTFRDLGLASEIFEDEFWSGGDLWQLYQEWRQPRRGREPEGMAGIFVAGYREYKRLSKAPARPGPDLVDGVHRIMRVALGREVETLESGLSFLATVGSTSPYVGLFGTVWGIMNSFRAIGAMEQATIAAVAPGIAEALIATAMGLFAAIPAVIAYNKFSNSAEQLVNRYELFMEEFLSLVNRQSHSAAGG